MRTTIILLFLSVIFTSNTLYSKNENLLNKRDFTTWPKSDVKKFGCFLEESFGYKDKKFNCKLKSYVNKGTPCANSEEYYEGVKFPKELSSKVDDRIDSIDLSWEHGELQEVSITFKKIYSKKELHKLFNLPKNANIQKCNTAQSCVTLTGFEHMGAGDVECGN